MGKQKHIAEPLNVMFSGKSNLCHIETNSDNPEGAGIPVCSMPKKNMATAERLVVCFNEMAGITDPKTWMESTEQVFNEALKLCKEKNDVLLAHMITQLLSREIDKS